MIAEISPILIGLLVAVFVIVSLMLVLIVLIQRPQGGGLSEAFGSSSGSGHTAFGARTGDALTYATIIVFVAFIGFSVGLNYLVRPPAPVDPSITSGPVTPTPEGAAPASTEDAKAEPATAGSEAPTTEAPATETPVATPPPQ